MGSSSSVQKKKLKEGDEGSKADKTKKDKQKTLEDHLEALRAAIDYLSICSNFKTKDCYSYFVTIRSASNPPGMPIEERVHIADLVIELDYTSLFPLIWSDLHSVDLSQGHGKNKQPEESVPHQAMSNLKAFKAAWWNFTDWSTPLVVELGTTTALRSLVSDLEDPDLAVDKMSSESRRFLIKGSLGTIHNMVRRDAKLRMHIRKIENCVNLFTAYSRSTFLIIQAKSFLILSYILCENEYAAMEATDNSIGFLVGMLRESLNYKNHKAKKYGFSSAEILQGLNQIALNDPNKVKVMDNGAVPLMVRMLGDNCSIEEQTLASEGLWKLAFAEDNKQRMRENTALMEAEDLKKPGQKRHTKVLPNKSHVMISYQWDVQQSMLSLRDALKNDGYNVWMDIDKLDGDILGGMADAVEQAAVVLVCFSQRYKDSQSCRTEATYAYKQNKTIVPLMVEPNYNPDGWLGALIGTLKYYKFYDESVKPSEYVELLHTLGNMGKQGYILPQKEVLTGSSKPVSISREPTLTLQTDSRQISGWSNSDVEEWLIKNDLSEAASKFKDIDGEMLYQMYKQLQRAPEFFHNAVSKELGLKYFQVLKFTRALEKAV
ncbi:hypothetical protein BSL78_14479 [Apostichopus japonicus]|uniref:TIR domain-containing protein n=1 Tax=Stichopus japonicus TaxID=307972 RepID=A0A2G8KL17_STIJA|nr:hypothetical protein BSL78_14479 [Apostichopus japonicus]